MLAIISFTVLGIWTLILGVINKCDWSSSNKMNPDLSLNLKASVDVEPIQQPCAIQEIASAQIPTQADNQGPRRPEPQSPCLETPISRYRN